MVTSAFDDFVKEVDAGRIWRVKELSNFRALTSLHSADTYSDSVSRAAVVIAYSHWEGFWSDCLSAYITFRTKEGRRPILVNRNFLIGMLGNSFKRLKDRNFSDEAKMEFVGSVFAGLNGNFAAVGTEEIRPRSNFDFKRLSYCANYLALDISPFQKYRNQIDAEVVGWRHSIAHGDSPTIDMTAVAGHLNLVERLTELIKDAFLNRAL